MSFSDAAVSEVAVGQVFVSQVAWSEAAVSKADVRGRPGLGGVASGAWESVREIPGRLAC